MSHLYCLADSGTVGENFWGWKVNTLFNKEQEGTEIATGAELVRKKRGRMNINAMVTYHGR